MINKKILSQHTEDHILIVPDALYQMEDVKTLLSSGDSVIFYKDLQAELVDIEFCTNAPCLVYIKTGQELITSADNDHFQLNPQDLIFFPKGINLYSDYLSDKGRLNAFLVFFDADIITDFLAEKTSIPPSQSRSSQVFKITPNTLFDIYFDALLESADQITRAPAILKHKLLELLHLVDLHDTDNLLRNNLAWQQANASKRNIVRLMTKHALSQLSVADFATLSGRSVASFNRDFKKHYAVPPKQWLTEQRLDFALKLLTESDLSVTEVALKIGYSNISHFIKAFKNQHGHTPNKIKNASCD